MSQPEPLYYVREFLNKPGHESIALIMTEVSERETWPTITIGDCSRQITINFPLTSEETRDNSLHKLDLLINTLLGFKDAWFKLVDAREEWEKNLAEDRARQSVGFKQRLAAQAEKLVLELQETVITYPEQQ